MAAYKKEDEGREGPSSNRTSNSAQPEMEMSGRKRAAIVEHATNIVRGFCMGAADTVPGVSGGTVALVLGHYERLITAISRIDRQAITLLRRGDVRGVALYLDLRFLLVLLFGIVLGIGSLASLMHWLLEHRHPQTMAVFFGLVLASGVVVGRRVERWDAASIVGLLLAIAFAAGLSMLRPSTANPTLPYLFFSATLAICAMILPGISGAFILLLLGVYHAVTEQIRNVVHGDISVDAIVRLAVFAVGCAVGLLAFSRVIKWLLQHYHSATLAALTGLMLGSLYKLWPLQLPTADTRALKFKLREFEFISPSAWPTSTLVGLAGLVLIAVVIVLVADAVGRRLES